MRLKLTIVYLGSDIAFQAFPTSTFTCVTASDDDDPNTGCKNCNAESLKFSLDDLKEFSFDTQNSLPQICNFKSADGLSTTYCSKEENGNRPAISFSCYTGTFSAETPKQPTVREKSFYLFCFSKILFTVYLLILARYRDRTVSVSKLWSQISHPNQTLFTVPLILNLSNRLKLTINAPKKSIKNI